MTTIEVTGNQWGYHFHCNCDPYRACEVNHAGTYVPIADYERLRRALEDIVENISKDKPSCTYCHHTIRVARKALEG